MKMFTNDGDADRERERTQNIRTVHRVIALVVANLIFVFLFFESIFPFYTPTYWTVANYLFYLNAMAV